MIKRLKVYWFFYKMALKEVKKIEKARFIKLAIYILGFFATKSIIKNGFEDCNETEFFSKESNRNLDKHEIFQTFCHVIYKKRK